MVLAARIREDLGLPGMTIEQTLPFRDKELMKQVLDAAGIRTLRHTSSSTVHQGVIDLEALEFEGYAPRSPLHGVLRAPEEIGGLEWIAESTSRSLARARPSRQDFRPMVARLRPRPR